MVDKSAKNPGLNRFRHSVPVRELELAASYPRAVISANARRGAGGKDPTPAPLIVWPNSKVMPGDKEFHDSANQRLAQRLKDVEPPAHPHPAAGAAPAHAAELSRELLAAALSRELQSKE
jgi:hypothetical protein